MRFILLVGLLAFALGLAACGDDDNSPTTTDQLPDRSLDADGDAEDSVEDIPPPEGEPGAAPTAPPLVEAEGTTTETGLQIIDIEVGDGAEVQAGATVTIHYTGWVEADGTKFDSSIDRGAPATFALSGLIQGWQEGIPGMKVGGVRRLIIPSELGYGDGGSPPLIPGGATLIFDIELLDLP